MEFNHERGGGFEPRRASVEGFIDAAIRQHSREEMAGNAVVGFKPAGDQRLAVRDGHELADFAVGTRAGGVGSIKIAGSGLSDEASQEKREDKPSAQP